MKSSYVTVTLLSLLAVPAGPPAEERRRDSDLEPLGKPGLGDSDPRPALAAAAATLSLGHGALIRPCRATRRPRQ